MLQKDIIRRCLLQHRPVIVATQMMESMITSSTPTRAEVNDVANAVLDHADAVMLSAETSVGKFPVEVVKAMNKILLEMETSETMFNVPQPDLEEDDRMVTDAICMASVRMAAAIDIKAKGEAVLKPGGLLMTYSCSGGVGLELFQKIIADAAHDAGREARIVRRLAGAADHPIALNFPEGDYLKGLLVQVD